MLAMIMTMEENSTLCRYLRQRMTVRTIVSVVRASSSPRFSNLHSTAVATWSSAKAWIMDDVLSFMPLMMVG